MKNIFDVACCHQIGWNYIETNMQWGCVVWKCSEKMRKYVRHEMHDLLGFLFLWSNLKYVVTMFSWKGLCHLDRIFSMITTTKTTLIESVKANHRKNSALFCYRWKNKFGNVLECSNFFFNVRFHFIVFFSSLLASLHLSLFHGILY